MPMNRLLSEAYELDPPASSNWPWLSAFRQQAQQDFAAQGLPTTRLETWKYTSVKALTETAFSIAPPPAKYERAETQSPQNELALSLPHYRLTFIAGHFHAGLSQLEPLPGNAKLIPLRQALEQEHTQIQAHLGRIAQHHNHPFAALNSLWLEDGVLLYLPADCQLDKPIHCLFYNPAGVKPQACYPRLLIVLEPGAQAQLIEEYLGASQQEQENYASLQEQKNIAPQFTDSLTEIVLARGAQLQHCKLLRENTQGHHIGGIHVKQAENSHFYSMSVSLGGGLCRNDIQVSLAGEGAQAQLDGLYILTGRQHLDNHLRVDHLQPGCSSEVFYKGIINGRARGVFNGMAIVHPGAQQSDARQVNKNLMLSTKAEMDTKPELQIEADDVKCSHGATVGQLDNEALFYLCSRGLDQDTARALLTSAFAHDVLNRVPPGPLREQLTTLTSDALAAQLGGDLSVKSNSSIKRPSD
ncbi:MAG: Fe-S cluster assembly protein SufD [Amphritea sp.]